MPLLSLLTYHSKKRPDLKGITTCKIKPYHYIMWLKIFKEKTWFKRDYDTDISAFFIDIDMANSKKRPDLKGITTWYARYRLFPFLWSFKEKTWFKRDYDTGGRLDRYFVKVGVFKEKTWFKRDYDSVYFAYKADTWSFKFKEKTWFKRDYDLYPVVYQPLNNFYKFKEKTWFKRDYDYLSRPKMNYLLP